MNINEVYIDKGMIDFIVPTVATMATRLYPKDVLDRIVHVKDEAMALQADLDALVAKLQTSPTPGIPGLAELQEEPT
jgi:hypothetical protein